MLVDVVPFSLESGWYILLSRYLNAFQVFAVLFVLLLVLHKVLEFFGSFEDVVCSSLFRS